MSSVPNHDCKACSYCDAYRYRRCPKHYTPPLLPYAQAQLFELFIQLLILLVQVMKLLNCKTPLVVEKSVRFFAACTAKRQGNSCRIGSDTHSLRVRGGRVGTFQFL
jgi:hypothetical protein